MSVILASSLMILCCSCSSKVITKTEYITQAVPSELLEIPHFNISEQKASNDKEVVARYVILWSFYEDLRIKLTKIRALQDENNATKDKK